MARPPLIPDKDAARAWGALCDACPYVGQPGPVFGRANPDAEIVVVGEAPGQQEVRMGDTFIGPSGQLLDACLIEAGLNRKQVFATNAVLCKPAGIAGEGISFDAVDCCRPRLLKELSVHNEAKVISMGGTAMEALLGGKQSKGVLANRGAWKWTLEGQQFLVSIHPAYVIRNPAECRDLIFDLQKLMKPVVALPKPAVVIIGDLDGLKAAVVNWKHADVAGWTPEIVYDLETDQVDWRHDKILCLTLCLGTDEYAYIVPGDLMYETKDDFFWSDFWSTPGVEFIGHNAKFDQKFMWYQLDWKPRLDFDTMLAHYTLDERKGTHDLKELARLFFNAEDYEDEMVVKYIGKKGGRYSGIPTDILYEYSALDVQYELHLKHKLEQQLKSDGLYDWPFKQITMRLSEAALQLELTGMYIDMDAVNKASEQFEQDATKLFNEMQGDVAEILGAQREKLGLRSGNQGTGTDAGASSTADGAEEALTQAAREGETND